MKILKFGGTSVGSIKTLKNTISIIKREWEYNNDLSVVTSTISGVTNLLDKAGNKAQKNNNSFNLEIQHIEEKFNEIISAFFNPQGQSHAKTQLKISLNKLEEYLHSIAILNDFSEKTKAKILSFGELIFTPILANILKNEGLPAYFVDASELICTNSNYLNAKVYLDDTYSRIKNLLDQNKNKLPIITGFIATNNAGVSTTLGRGGSDYTAALVAAATIASEIQIWTDVDGMLTADPKLVSNAHPLDQLSYQEAMELTHFGAKVLYPPALAPAFTFKIPLLIKNTFNPKSKGTLVTSESRKSNNLIKGISSLDNVTLITVSGSIFVGVPGTAAKLFNNLAREGINIILITQSSSEHSICIGLSEHDSIKAISLIKELFKHELSKGFVDPLSIKNNESIIAIIGENMNCKPGISSKLFSTLGNNGINVDAIAQGSSEMNISAVINRKDLKKAANALHQVFFYDEKKFINVYLCGTGQIGLRLLKQIKRQTQFLSNSKGLEIRVVGMSNTKKMIFDVKGVCLENALQTMIEKGEQACLELFIKTIFTNNLSNSVFVDCTSNELVTHYYEEVLKNAISIVTPNKLANSGDLGQYKKLKQTAFTHGVHFLYETNVGAGLPIINTLNDLKNSGDEFYEIEGVLSGTMSYIFNTFDEKKSFSEVVKIAKEKGYTEPDPREDIKGNDVARKILILAREAGFEVEPNHIKMDPILPVNCLEAKTINDFFIELEKEDNHFDELRINAKKENKVLRFIAKADKDNVSVALKAVGVDHPFYNLSGSDNIISFKTRRYSDRQLVVKGPGAGVAVTAAGVFAEIISISKSLYQSIKKNNINEDA